MTVDYHAAAGFYVQLLMRFLDGEEGKGIAEIIQALAQRRGSRCHQQLMRRADVMRARSGDQVRHMSSRKTPAACTCKLSYERFGKSFADTDRISSRMIEVSERNVIRPGGQEISGQSRSNGPSPIVPRNRRRAGRRRAAENPASPGRGREAMSSRVRLPADRRERDAAASDINRPR